jgi:hypothetical protein
MEKVIKLSDFIGKHVDLPRDCFIGLPVKRIEAANKVPKGDYRLLRVSDYFNGTVYLAGYPETSCTAGYFTVNIDEAESFIQQALMDNKTNKILDLI